MKIQRKLAELRVQDGGLITLHERDGVYSVRLDGRSLMDSSVAASELMLGDLGMEGRPTGSNLQILIGGLGLGFTLKRVLELVGPDASVHVAELLPEMVEWNRSFLQDLNGKCLADPRVELVIDDVWHVLTHAKNATYDVVLLDVDNGPVAIVKRGNARLYDHDGIARIAGLLAPGGRAAIWSAARDEHFEKRLKKSGLRVKMVPAKSHAGARSFAHMIYVVDIGG